MSFEKYAKDQKLSWALLIGGVSFDEQDRKLERGADVLICTPGRLLDQSGLKGERVGDAEVSPVHANFIVNRGHATSADLIALVRRIRARVHA
eukprot:gene2415-3140_t